MKTQKKKKITQAQKNIQALFSMARRLNRIHFGTREFFEMKIQDYSPGYVSKEDGFTYPEAFEVKIQNYSNHFFTFRVEDGRFIREGATLSGPGLSVAQVYKRQLREFRDYLKMLKESQKAAKHGA